MKIITKYNQFTNDKGEVIDYATSWVELENKDGRTARLKLKTPIKKDDLNADTLSLIFNVDVVEE